jgi:hypothetical protein
MAMAIDKRCTGKPYSRALIYGFTTGREYETESFSLILPNRVVHMDAVPPNTGKMDDRTDICPYSNYLLDGGVKFVNLGALPSIG